MTYKPTSEEYVRAAIEAGFQTHELSPSMRDFAHRIAYDARQKLRAELQADGWRQCAKGQHTTQFCGQLEDAVKAEREACAQVCEVVARDWWKYPDGKNQAKWCIEAIRERGTT